MSQDENKLGEVKYLADKQKDRYLKPKRQKHSHEKKLQVVSEALTPGASISAVARRHGLNTNLVFTWIRQYEGGSLLAPSRRELALELEKFISAGLIPRPEKPEDRREELPQGDVIEIETRGGVKVRLSGAVNGRILNMILAELWKLPS